MIRDASSELYVCKVQGYEQLLPMLDGITKFAIHTTSLKVTIYSGCQLFMVMAHMYVNILRTYVTNDTALTAILFHINCFMQKLRRYTNTVDACVCTCFWQVIFEPDIVHAKQTRLGEHSSAL